MSILCTSWRRMTVSLSYVAPSHRPLRGVALGLFTAMVTRIILTSSPEAKGEGCLKVLLKETTKLRSRAVWDESLVEEWSAVRKQDPSASCGRVFSILGEKKLSAMPLKASVNIKLALGSPATRFKLRPAWCRRICFRKCLAPRLLWHLLERFLRCRR